MRNRSREAIGATGRAAALALVLSLRLVTAHGGGRAGLEVTSRETTGARAVALGLADSPEAYAPLVYSVPDQSAVQILTLSYDRASEYLMDIYYPPGLITENFMGHTGAPADFSVPVVLFPLGFSVERLEIWGQDLPRHNPDFLEWGSLFAAHGMAAVSYDAAELDVAFDRAVNFLREHENALGLDLSRLAIWAASGHGRFSSHVMGRREIEQDLRAAMFIHSDARPNIMPNGDFELYIIYTAGDHYDRLSAALVRRAELQGIPVVQENRAPYKGFYLTDRTAISSEIVQHAVHWMQLRLGASSLPIRPGGHQ